MAKRNQGVGIEFTGNSKGFEKAATQVGASAKQVKKELKSVQLGSKEMVDGFGALGNAVGGMVGDIAGALTSLITAGGPIAMVTAAIGGIAMAWKNSQENLELYLKSANKLQFGFAGYNIDANAERNLTRKRAMGQITAGRTALTAANAILELSGTTPQQRADATAMRESARLQIAEGMALRDVVMGVRDKVKWELEYNKLLQDQEALNDKGLLNKERWAGLEAELVKQRTIIQDKDVKAADKALAIVEAERIANQLLKEKNSFIDAQLINVNALAKMTMTQEVVEGKVADLQTQKNNNLREYGVDLLKVLKMETRVSKELQTQLEIKRASSVNMVGTGGISIGSFGSISTDNKLRGGPTKAIQDLNDGMYQEMILIGELENAFAGMFASIGGGFRGMADSLINSLERIAIQLAAKAAVFGILKVLFPGIFIGLDLYKSGSFGKTLINGFASGTNFAPGGLSLVGERGPELVNLPRGSRVTPNNQLGGTVRLQAVLKGRDIYLSGQMYGNMLSQNT